MIFATLCNTVQTLNVAQKDEFTAVLCTMHTYTSKRIYATLQGIITYLMKRLYSPDCQ